MEYVYIIMIDGKDQSASLLLTCNSHYTNPSYYTNKYHCNFSASTLSFILPGSPRPAQCLGTAPTYSFTKHLEWRTAYTVPRHGLGWVVNISTDIPHIIYRLISMIPYILPLEVYTRWSQPLILYLNIRLDTSCSATGRTRGFSTLGLPRHAASLHTSMNSIFIFYIHLISTIYSNYQLNLYLFNC